MSHSALVVGLGQIGMGYDIELAPEFVLTHARAFAQHPAFALVGGVDSDPARRNRFEQVFGKPAFADLATALACTRPLVVAICVPTEMHAATVDVILACSQPLAILCEKPLSYDLDDARHMVAACTQRNCRLVVNYLRRADPGSMEIKHRLEQGRIEAPIKGVVWYSKGVLNNGSHFLDLLRYWLGPVRASQVIDHGRCWQGNDTEPDLYLTFDQGSMYLLAAREENFSHYTIEWVAGNGRLRYEQGGGRILWQPVVGDDTYSGYRILSANEEVIATDLDRIQWHVVEQLAESLDGKETPLCSGPDALQTLEILSEVTKVS